MRSMGQKAYRSILGKAYSVARSILEKGKMLPYVVLKIIINNTCLISKINVYYVETTFQRKVLMNTAHLFGRKRNCWTIAIRAMQKQLQIATWGRRAFRADFMELCNTRIEAASYENG